MNLKERYLATQTFLTKHRTLWAEEILWQHPHFSSPYKEWSLELMDSSPQELIQLEILQNFSLIKDRNFLLWAETIKNLCSYQAFDSQEFKTPFSHWSCSELTPKKYYEINQISHYLEKNKRPGLTLDLCGGAAHLAQFLALQNNLDLISLDHDIKLHDKARLRWKKYNQNLKIELIQDKLHSQTCNSSWIKEKKIQTSLGLHTCGVLGEYHLDLFLNSSIACLINIPCCYYKTTNLLGLSQVAKEYPIDYTYPALHLAAKCLKNISDKEFTQREQLKFYRYALEIFLKEEKIIQSPFHTGPIRRLRHLSFEDFCEIIKERTQINFSIEKALTFYKSQSNQTRFKLMIRLGIIRNMLGRLIEASILLDRALLLEERGHQVEIKQIFDPQFSPRGLGIFATKKEILSS